MTTEQPPLSATPRTRLTRKKARAASSRDELYQVLDNALVCHFGMLVDGRPVVLPTGYARDGDTLYLHGSSGARSLLAASEGVHICVTVTLLDGIVYSRAVNDHSMNYRSAMVYGRTRPVTDRDEKLHTLRTLTDQLAPGSWEHAREVSPKELAAVSVVAVSLAEASVKMRRGGPTDAPTM